MNTYRSKFHKFLVMHGVHADFYEAFNNCFYREDWIGTNSPEYFWEHVSPYDYLQLAFRWMDTPQGHYFWMNLGQNWRAHGMKRKYGLNEKTRTI